MDTRFWRNVALSLAVSAGFLYLALRNVQPDELIEALRRARPGGIMLAIGVSLVLMVFRAWRWQLELLPLERIPLGRLWVVTAVAYMAINLLPARLGEVVRPWLLSRRSSVSFSNVVGNLVVEKTMDSVVILFYMLTGLLTVENLPGWVRTGAVLPSLFVVTVVVARRDVHRPLGAEPPAGRVRRARQAGARGDRRRHAGAAQSAAAARRVPRVGGAVVPADPVELHHDPRLRLPGPVQCSRGGV